MRRLDTLAQVAQQLTQAEAAGQGLIRDVLSLAPTQWMVALAQGGIVHAEWIDCPGRLVLSASLGHPPPGEELPVLRAALAYNAPWHRQPCLRIARDGPGGELMLVALVRGEDLCGEGLLGALARFEATRALWSVALDGDAG